MQVQRYFFIDALHFHPLPPPVRIHVGPPHPSSTSFLGPPHPSCLSCFFSNGAFSHTAYCVSSNSVRNQFVVFTTRAGRALAIVYMQSAERCMTITLHVSITCPLPSGVYSPLNNYWKAFFKSRTYVSHFGR
jgi:hypothetical protein